MKVTAKKEDFTIQEIARIIHKNKKNDYPNESLK